MLKYNCLIKNTQLYNDLSQFVKKIMYDRVAKGQNVSIKDVYKDARDSNFWDVDLNSVGEMYKDIAPQLKAKVGKGILDTDKEVDKVTGRSIDAAIKRILSKKREKVIQEVGQDKPSQAIVKDILRLFDDDYINVDDNISKTTMKEMQDAIKKAATAMIERQGKQSKRLTFEEILNEALRLDSLAVNDLNGRLNTMDDLFNQVSDEVDTVIAKMEASKKGMPQFKKDEIDQRIEQMKAYTENIKQGAYTLALSRGEQQQVLRDILKQKYGKQVTVNGQSKTVLDWNKMFTSVQDFRQDVADVLSSKGFTPQQIDKIVAALKVQFDALKSTSQWNNVATATQKRAIADDKFLSRAAAEVVMGKQDSKGEFYKKLNTTTRKYEPDWDRWSKDSGQTKDELKTAIKNDIEKNGSASEYRQTISELARRNNPAMHISKSDLEKLSALQQRHGFDELFNAKVFNILGLSEKDAEAGRQIEELSKKVKEVLDKGGQQSRVAMSKILDNINAVMAQTQGEKSRMLAFAKQFEWVMGNRNAYRLLNYLNFVENNLSGVNQMVQTKFQSFSPEVAKKEFSKMMSVAKDVAAGGKHFDMTDSEKLSYHAHEYRFDPNKSMEHNIKAAMSFVPNLMLGVMDSAAHAYTMRIMFYNSAVLTNLSKLSKDRTDELIGNGYSEAEANKMVKAEQKELKQKAIDNVADVLYDPTQEQEALKRAEEVLKITTANPTKNEIKREADNIMLSNLVSKGILYQGQLEALLKASDISAKKAIGKESAFKGNPFSEGLTKVNSAARARIKKDIQNGNLTRAAWRIIGNSVAMKGIFPFLTGAANWGVIALKKTPLGLLRAIQYNKQSFRDQVAMASELDDKKLGEIMEQYNSRRNDIYLSLQGMVWTGLILSALAGWKATGDDDDKNLFEFINKEFKKMSEDNRERKMLTRWLPPLFQTYNLLTGNVQGKGKSSMIDNAGQLFGYGAMESPFTKATKYTGSKHTSAGFGQVLGGIFDIGAYYNAFNSYADLVGDEQEEKVKSHSTYLGDKAGVPDNDFINGIISGMMGYNLHQDINHWTGFRPSK